MASILITPTPKGCKDCKFTAVFDDNELHCVLTRYKIEGDNQRCPLVPYDEVFKEDKKCGSCFKFKEWPDAEEPGEGYCLDGKGIVSKEHRCCGHWNLCFPGGMEE